MAELPTFNIENLRFLIVDGDENMRNVVVNILQTFGVRERFEANNVEEAFKILKDYKPDIIVCEWELDNISGVDFTKKIRKGEDYSDPMVAIIFLTAHTYKWQIENARDAGITEYLSKPISADTLYSRICSVIENPRPFIEGDTFIGPDRRRQHDPFKVGNARRESDKSGGEDGDGEISDDEINAMLGM